MAPDGVKQIQAGTPSTPVNEHPENVRVNRKPKQEQEEREEKRRPPEDRVTIGSRGEEAAPEKEPRNKDQCTLPTSRSIDVKV